MPEDPSLSSLITTVFSAWRQAGIKFLVLRNYDELPAATSNDIDILVGPAQRNDAERLLVSAAKTAGFRLHNRAEFATLALYFSREDSRAQAHFDLFTNLKWRGFDFLSCETFLEKKVYRGSFAIPHPAHEAATNLLASFIYTGSVKEKYRPGITAAFRAEPSAAIGLLARTYGLRLADAVVSLAMQEQWPAIERQAGKLRRALVLRQILWHPWKLLTGLLADGRRLIKRFLRPPGLFIVLAGPDGSGKSTVAAKIADDLRLSFSPAKSRYIHWKPRVFSRSKGAGEAAVNPQGRPARNRLLSLAFFGVHWLEFFLGGLGRIHWTTFKGGLVIVDRFYYDFFVDQKRYRLQVAPGVVRCGYALLPKPDRVYLLDAPSEILRRRKQEVPPEETSRQRAAYLDLVKNLPNGAVMDASQPVETVTTQVERDILNFMVARQQRRN